MYVKFGFQTLKTFGDMALNGQMKCNLVITKGHNSAIFPSMCLKLDKPHSHTPLYTWAKFKLKPPNTWIDIALVKQTWDPTHAHTY